MDMLPNSREETSDRPQDLWFTPAQIVTCDDRRVCECQSEDGSPTACMPSIERVAEADLPTEYGQLRVIAYQAPGENAHLALVLGSVDGGEPVLVRLHSECLTGDVLRSCRCDCGGQLEGSLQLLQQQGRGILLYMRQEGRGIGLVNKIRAYAIQDQGYDTVEANLALGLPEDMREYQQAAEMLLDLRVRQVRLLTNNPAKIQGLQRHGITVTERVALQVSPNASDLGYLETKREKMGHLLPSTLLLADDQDPPPLS